MDPEPLIKHEFESDDVILPPHQVETAFRFLDLPAEIRNMIYDFACQVQELESGWIGGFCRECGECHNDHEYLSHMKQQWYPPPLASVSKQLRQEVMPIFYARNTFDWFWDPEREIGDYGEMCLQDSIFFLKKALKFLTANNLWMKCVRVRRPDNCLGPLFLFPPLLDSVCLLAPLLRSQSRTRNAHPALGKICLPKGLSFTRRIFNFVGSLSRKVLKDEDRVDEKLRTFLREDTADGAWFLRQVEEFEDEMHWMDQHHRQVQKHKRFLENTVKGAERWNGVLRNRTANVQQ